MTATTAPESEYEWRRVTKARVSHGILVLDFDNESTLATTVNRHEVEDGMTSYFDQLLSKFEIDAMALVGLPGEVPPDLFLCKLIDI